MALVFDRAFAFRFREDGPFGLLACEQLSATTPVAQQIGWACLSLVTALHLKAAWLNVHTSSEAGARGTTPLKILFALPEVPNCRTFTLSL